MKKVILGLTIILVLFSSVLPDAWVWCKRVLLSEPTTHQIQKGEYLSQLSLKYYGSAEYWRELALVNRAPNADLVFPEESLFIPSKEVILQLHKARSFSQVNTLFDGEKNYFASLQKSPKSTSETGALVADSTKVTAGNDTTNAASPIFIKSNDIENGWPMRKMLLFLSGLSVLLLVLLAITIYRKVTKSRAQKLQEESDLADTPEPNRNDYEPSYTDYKKRRSARVFV